MVNAIVVADTSVLINFLRIDRMDLIGAHPASFIATDHVAAEIADTYPEQQARYAAALSAAHISEQRIDDPSARCSAAAISSAKHLPSGGWPPLDPLPLSRPERTCPFLETTFHPPWR